MFKVNNKNTRTTSNVDFEQGNVSWGSFKSVRVTLQITSARGGRGSKYKGGGSGGLKNVLGQKWQLVITSYGCPKQNVFAPYLNIVDTGATTLKKIRKANQGHFTTTQSRNIQRYLFETSLI